MDVPRPHDAVAALAAFVLTRIAEAGSSLFGLRDAAPQVSAEQAQEVAVIVAAAAPFAQSSYARARLLRQLHASGALSVPENVQTLDAVGVAR